MYYCQRILCNGYLSYLKEEGRTERTPTNLRQNIIDFIKQYGLFSMYCSVPRPTALGSVRLTPLSFLIHLGSLSYYSVNSLPIFMSVPRATEVFS